MIGFPNPYFDEALYSLAARYHALLPFQDYKSTQLELFGSKSISAVIDLPYALESFHSANSQALTLTVDEIIERYTLFPYYSNFITVEKQQKLFGLMKSNRGSTIHASIGINASLFRRSRFPKYCSECLIEDIKNVGEPYWHLAHQIPDILICPIHNTFLAQARPDLSGYSRFSFLNPKKYAQALTKLNELNELKNLAGYQLEIHFKNLPFELDKINYEEKSQQLNFYKKSSLNFLKIVDAFTSFHSKSLLNHLFPSFHSPGDYRWICDIIKRPRHIFHPIRQILVRKFFESYEHSQHLSPPEEKEKYECINKAAEHYGQKVVDQISNHIDPKTKRLIATLTCSCGMVYTQSTIKNALGEDVKFRRVKEFGVVWMSRLDSELQSGKSFRQIARELGTDAKTVSVLKRGPKKAITLTDPISNLREGKRAEWIILLEKYPSNKVKNARLTNGALYAWLYRNDNDWLISINKLYLSVNEFNQLKLDWEKLDQHLIKQIAAIVSHLKAKKYKGRITRTIISKIINAEKYIQGTNLNKIPQAKKLLNQVCESVEDYQIRRIDDCISLMVEKQESLPIWRIIRQTGLSNKVSDKIKSYLYQKVDVA
ncbi:MAG: TniQ family protein [Cyclobacteriaceae bacterium]|nr:TniQ family protein [Cyclobacteriaceae bacterium]